MLTKSARPAGGEPDRAAISAFRWTAENEAFNTEIPQLRQAAQRRLQRQRAVERVHRLGARVTFELFEDLARRYPEIADDLDRRLDRFARLDLAMVAVAGGDRFAPLPTRLVGDNR
jgi:hypothetical protein